MSATTETVGLRLREALFSVALGLLLCLTLVKFGNPVILHDGNDELKLEDQVRGAADGTSILLQPWPLSTAYFFLGVVLLFSWGFWKRPAAVSLPKWILIMPVIWLGWQLVAGIDSVRPSLTNVTVLHFVACVVCFYLGLLTLPQLKQRFPLQMMILLGVCITIGVGWYQYFVGLEATRQFFYQLPNWQEFPATFRAKIRSQRIFGTLFYPNAFAGALLLYLPYCLGTVARLASAWPRYARVALLTALAGAAVCALYWSGSKAAWLILIVMVVFITFRHAPLSKRWKLIATATLLVVGLSTFFVRYSGYFSRGATSVVARFDYWKAALQAAQERPWTGSGPGTFMVEYAKRKDSGAEMTRLAHNDYLQQASDSGWVAFLSYLTLTGGVLTWLYRQRISGDAFLLWLGAFALTLQACLEFPLYLPALAWPYFVFLGWLCGDRSRESGSSDAFG